MNGEVLKMFIVQGNFGFRIARSPTSCWISMHQYREETYLMHSIPPTTCSVARIIRAVVNIKFQRRNVYRHPLCCWRGQTRRGYRSKGGGVRRGASQHNQMNSSFAYEVYSYGSSSIHHVVKEKHAEAGNSNIMRIETHGTKFNDFIIFWKCLC